MFDVAYSFCTNNIPWMGNRMEFGCDGDERWAILPEAKPKTRPKAKAKKAAKAESSTAIHPDPPSPAGQAKTLSLEERLRQALLARLAA